MKIKLFTIPNILTLGNLFCGLMAIVFALRYNDLQLSFNFIVIAAVFDFLDGFAARLLHAYSAIGKELDSLADVVSFGVAPTFILLNIYQTAGGESYGPMIFILAAFSALRLAKFNIDENQTTSFIGLPTPACALFVASAGYLYAEGVYTVAPFYTIWLAVILSYFLVCNTPMFAFKFSSYALKDNEIKYIFILLSVVSLIIWQILAIPFIIMTYIALSVVMNFLRLVRK